MQGKELPMAVGVTRVKAVAQFNKKFQALGLKMTVEE